MSNWPTRPVIYEINTWVWLSELSRRHAQPVTLANVPESVWDALGGWNIDAVWLMGVWERSPEGRRIALGNERLMADLRQTLPDLQPDEVIGSPFCIRRYEVDPHLGGREGLACAREALARRGIRLILDFVPNHVAPDHPWTVEHPEYFIQGSEEDLARAPSDWLRVGPTIFARGRDPHFAPWPEVLQLNAFNPGLRAAASATLRDIAAQCDGVRCDMAMLLMNDIFAQTWGRRAGPPPATEYWAEVLAPM
ncbi:MAG: alpha-amylase family glycosyl hydrolase, partial [Chloroflexaceae bacterium]